jgi:hypothetical protein
MAATAAQLDSSADATIDEVEYLLWFMWSWSNLATRLMCVAVGILVALYGALAPGLTREDRITVSCIACAPFMVGAVCLGWVAYVRVQLLCYLERMRAAAASPPPPGEQRTDGMFVWLVADAWC